MFGRMTMVVAVALCVAGCMTSYPKEGEVNVDIDEQGVIAFLDHKLTLDGLPKALKRAGVDSDRRIFVNVPPDFSPRLKQSIVTILSRADYWNIKFRWGEKKLTITTAPPTP